MAQEIQSWRPPIGSSLEQKASSSRKAIAIQASPADAIKAAKQLIGCYPHARPPDPEVYVGALAATLAQYPLGLVQECVDPRTGLARGREFPPTVACVVDWCENRLKYHQSLANFNGMPHKRIDPPVDEKTRAIASHALRKLWAWMQAPKEDRGEPPKWADAALELAAPKAEP